MKTKEIRHGTVSCSEKKKVQIKVLSQSHGIYCVPCFFSGSRFLQLGNESRDKIHRNRSCAGFEPYRIPAPPPTPTPTLSTALYSQVSSPVLGAEDLGGDFPTFLGFVVSNRHADVRYHLEQRFPHSHCIHGTEFQNTESDVSSEPPNSPEGSPMDTSDTEFLSSRNSLMLYKMVTPPKERLTHVHNTYKFFPPV